MRRLRLLKEQILEPKRAMRASYLPFLMVYFAYGLGSITGIASDFWVMEVMQFSDQQLSIAAFWMGVPWTLKMLFGQFVDARPIMGSPRRAYIFLGAFSVSIGYLVLAGLAGGSPLIANNITPITAFYLSNVLVVVGLVIQDVTADAMTSEMNTGDEKDSRSIQVLGRIAMGLGGLSGAIFASSVALIGRNYSYATVFLIGLVVPAISIAGAIIWKQRLVERAQWNKPILFGGLGFAIFVLAINLTSLPMKAEIVWLGSTAAIAMFLYVLARTLDRAAILALLATGAVFFVFRAMPGAGPGVGWWQKEILGFDELFLGRLQTFGSVLGLAGLILAARSIRNYSIAPVLVFITVIGTILSLPTIGMYYGLHNWTEAHFGFGARTIVVVDAALSSPFGDIAMVPVLALLAMIARFGNPATWFAVGASFMNLALSTSSIMTKWLVQIWPVTQAKRLGGIVVTPGDYRNLGTLMILTTVLGFVLPLIMIWIFKKQLNFKIETPR